MSLSFDEYYKKICIENKITFCIDAYVDFEGDNDQRLTDIMDRFKKGEEICCLGNFTIGFRSYDKEGTGYFYTIGWDMYEQDDEGNDTEQEVDYFKFESVRDAVRLAVNRSMEPCLKD